MCGVQSHPPVDTDPWNILDLRTDSGFLSSFVHENLRMRTDADLAIYRLYFYLQVSKHDMRVIHTYVTQNIVCWLFW